jgi:hypothetical protein
MENYDTPKRFNYPASGFKEYWEHENGKNLLNRIDYIPDLTEIKLKIPFLFESDNLADEVVNEMYLKLGFNAANEIINNASEHGIQSIPNAPLSLVNLFNQVYNVPEWLDWNKIDKGSAFCRRSSDFGLLVLRNFCLMGGYESSAINKPLIFTGALHKGATKRLEETTQFWLKVTEDGALFRKNKGFKEILKVRLLHAYTRIMILNESKWDSSLWGIPLNSWDMLATNLGFSIVFLDGLKRLGFKPSDEEIEGLFHFWKYIGFLLGINLNLLPNNEEQAIRLLYEWTITQPSADEDTIALAHALLSEPLDAKFPKYKWQKRIIYQVHLSYFNFLLGPEACQRLQIKRTNTFLPYSSKLFNVINESLISYFPKYYRIMILQGRKKQLKIIEKFLDKIIQ